MMPESRWDRLEALFERVRNLPATEQDAFIERECAGDPALKSELAALLDAADAAPDYLNRLGDELLGSGIRSLLQESDDDAQTPDPWIGRTVGHYEIQDSLGGGGMGVVYRARDLALDRTVALKFIAPEISRDADAKRQFMNEARAASALDHPNICTIHEIGEAEGGRLFIAMSSYEGETLKARMARGTMSVEETLEIATQIARALAVAHAHEIVHRDVKPANVFITQDGIVKLLDFGLAKRTSASVSTSGTIKGTVAYMSPEQTRGEPTDVRTDVWSAGVVLYEMLAGSRPFDAEDPQATIHSILTSQPKLRAKRTDLPLDLIQVVEKSMAKPREQRYADGAALLEALEECRAAGISGAQVSWTRQNVARGAAVVAVLVAVIAAFVILLRTSAPSRVTDPSPSAKQVSFTGDVVEARISPDGNVIAFVSASPGDSQRLMMQDIDGGPVTQIFASMLMVCCPSWSRGSNRLAFGAELDTWTVPRHGTAEPERVVEGRVMSSWSPVGMRLASWHAKGANVWIVDLRTRRVTDSVLLDMPFEWLRNVAWSPTSERLAVATSVADTGELWTVDVGERSTWRRVVETDTPVTTSVWAAGGRDLYYLQDAARGRDVWRVSVGADGSGIARPQQVLEALPAGVRFELAPALSLSADRSRLLYVHELSYANLWLARLDTTADSRTFVGRQLTTGTALRSTPRLSPDERRIAFVEQRGVDSHLMVMDLSDGAARRLTFLEREVWSPAWSPDAKEIAFGSNHNWPAVQVWTVDAENGRSRPFENTTQDRDNHISWGALKNIIHQTRADDDLLILDASSGRERPLVGDRWEGVVYDPRPSPDGRSIAVYVFSQEAENGLWVFSLDGTTATHLGSEYTPIGWTDDAQGIYALRGERGDPHREVYVVPLSGADPRVHATLPFAAKPWEVSISIDGNVVVAAVTEIRSDAWLVENFDSERER